MCKVLPWNIFCPHELPLNSTVYYKVFFLLEGLRHDDAQGEVYGLHHSQKMQHHPPDRSQGKSYEV